MKTKKTLFVICAIGLASLSAGAQIVLNGTDGELGGLTPTVGSGSGLALPTYNTPNANAWTIVSPDNVSGGIAQFNDTASILIPNGYAGASFGTLSSLLAQGAAGNVSFTLASMTPGVNLNYYAYWDITLTDPNHPSTDIVLANAYSDNQLGVNPLNQGTSVNTSAEVFNGAWSSLFETWATAEGQTPVAGDPTLANWNVSSLGIAVGGWDSGTTETAVISSVTVPGVDPVPDAAMTLPLLGLGFGTLAGLRRRLQRA